jgi:hypothetical protein
LFIIIIIGIPSHQQNLGLKGVLLDDCRTIGDYGINKGTSVDLISLTQPIQIFIKNNDGKRTPLEVTHGDSILSVKQQYELKESIFLSLFFFFILFYFIIIM